MKIETERLILLPLTVPQLELWTTDIPALENELQCSYKGDSMEGFWLGIVKNQIEVCKKDLENILFRTFWFIILKHDRTIIGTIDFKNLPNESGEAEIGYGLSPDYRKKGYMTEAVNGFKEWAFQQPSVQSLLAETEKDNLPSQNVLKRCNFQLTLSSETLWWSIKKQNDS